MAPRPLGVIANRVQPNTETHAKLQHFLACLDVPTVATFRDCPLYMEAAELGKGIIDMVEYRAARKEAPAWWELMKWIDAQPKNAEGRLRSSPRAADRRPTEDRSLTA